MDFLGIILYLVGFGEAHGGLVVVVLVVVVVIVDGGAAAAFVGHCGG